MNNVISKKDLLHAAVEQLKFMTNYSSNYAKDNVSYECLGIVLMLSRLGLLDLDKSRLLCDICDRKLGIQ